MNVEKGEKTEMSTFYGTFLSGPTFLCVTVKYEDKREGFFIVVYFLKRRLKSSSTMIMIIQVNKITTMVHE